MALLNERVGMLVGGGKNSKEEYLKCKYEIHPLTSFPTARMRDFRSIAQTLQ